MSPYGVALAGILTPKVLLWLLAGSVLGLSLSSLPGVGPAVAIAILLPLTFHLSPLIGLVFLTSLYQAAEYSGSITAIAVGTPGAPPSAAIILDGYALTKNGEPGRAFAYSLWSAVCSAALTGVCLLLLAEPLSSLAARVRPADLAIIDVVALALVGTLTQNASKLKGLAACALGVLLSTVGLDPVTGYARYTFGSAALLSGIPLVPLLVGAFAFPEALRLILVERKRIQAIGRARRVWLSFREARAMLPFSLFGSLIGFVLGTIPGVAGTVPPWVSYGLVKSRSKHPERFGTGVPEGIVAPEATNSAVMHSTLIPTFFLGVPGTSTSAVLIGAMTIAGLQPGPLLFSQHRTLVLSIFEALVIGALMLFVLGLLLTNGIARVVTLLPRHALGVSILIIGLVGSYVSTGSRFGMIVAVVAGVGSLFLVSAGFSIPALVIGFILGGQLETNTRTALSYANGSPLVFVERPLGIAMLILLVLFLLMRYLHRVGTWTRFLQVRRARRGE